MRHSEQNLDLDLLRNGTPQQRATLINQFRDYLRGLAHEEVKRKPGGQLTVSDFVQRTIIQADQCMDQCQATDVQQFKAWLRKIMIHEILNRRKFLNQGNPESGRKHPFQTSLVSSQTARNSEQVFQDEKSVLMNAIDKLSEEYQTVILARHRDNQTFAQIGKAMNRTPDAVRMIWNRAIKQLSGILKSLKESDGDGQTH